MPGLRLVINAIPLNTHPSRAVVSVYGAALREAGWGTGTTNTTNTNTNKEIAAAVAAAAADDDDADDDANARPGCVWSSMPFPSTHTRHALQS
jgi:hypothetical protein